jgi:hypothetical protein
MIGQRSLFNNLIETYEAPKNPRGGRDPELLKERDQLIVARYYYMVRIKKMQYPAALADLRKQFFYSEIIIQRVLQANEQELFRFKENKPTAKYFRKLYPWLIW